LIKQWPGALPTLHEDFETMPPEQPRNSRLPEPLVGHANAGQTK